MTVPDSSDAQPRDQALRYVAFVDVLGFSDLVMKTPHDMLLNIYNGTLQMAADYGVTGGSMRLDGDGKEIPETDLATVNMRIVSDSVLLWTDDDASPEFVALVMAVSGLLGAGIATGIPLRAAITWGPATHQTLSYDSPRLGGESLVGRALVEAYNAEGRQQWSGGHVTPGAMDHWEQTGGYGAPTPQQMQGARWLQAYDVPMKDGTTERLWAIDWTRHLSGPTDGLIRHSFTEWGKSVRPEDEVKVENTVAFARHVGVI